jgi:hypothetical protein
MLASLSVSQRCSTTCPSLTRLQRIRCKGRGHSICVVTVCCWVACIGPHPPWGLISSVYQQRPMSPSGLPHTLTHSKKESVAHTSLLPGRRNLPCCLLVARHELCSVGCTSPSKTASSCAACCAVCNRHHLILSHRCAHIYILFPKRKKNNKRTPRYYLFMFTNIYILRTHLQKYLDYILGRS